jgi:hypothetical protein
MINANNIKEKLTSLLLAKYPTYKVYGVEVAQGYTKPSFFVDVRLISLGDGTINIVKKNFRVHIIYFQKEINEADQYAKYEEIAELLIADSKKNPKKKMCLNIKDEDYDRFIPVTDFSYDYVGNDTNILSINFSLQFFDFKNIEDTEPTMEEVDLNKIIEMEE